MFDSLPHAISIGERQEIESLLSELQLDESMIMEEFGALWPRLHETIQTRSAGEAKEAIRSELAAIEEKKKRIGRLATEILTTF